LEEAGHGNPNCCVAAATELVAAVVRQCRACFRVAARSAVTIIIGVVVSCEELIQLEKITKGDSNGLSLFSLLLLLCSLISDERY
jgi:hypothetical protein